MYWFRVFFYVTIIVGLPFVVVAEPKVIPSVTNIKEDVSALLEQGVRAEDIVVVWDFHGVITTQQYHGDLLTLNPDILEVLEYLKKERVSQVVATAWDDFSVIQKGIISLELESYFDVDLTEAPLQDIKLEGKRGVDLKGYKNGRAVALREPDDQDKYFRRKGYAPEVCFPERVFQRVFFIDDTLGNIQIFEKDFKNTIHYNEDNQEKLKLYHLKSPQKDQEAQFPEASVPDARVHQPRVQSLSESGSDDGSDFF